ncbi:hypothetical protein [Aeoliella sp.]|uniref:hypothetical protein n=1 Tax=Aeoliella sp. TaxID=2795800 RepID=UPI003CCB7F34
MSTRQRADLPAFGPWPCSDLLEAHRLCHLDGSGELEYSADDSVDSLGFLTRDVHKVGDKRHVWPVAMGTPLRAVADGVIGEGAIVYQADEGKLSATGTIRRGVSLEAAVDGDYFDFLPS